ncbi:hypothetical protein AGOR_G00231850 [Albula goreensis]|uniref:phosphoglycerate mutase (2,3-diphosphoglycerate-dependent) n=1 Tax=Albula goreensis TaxID=1534307 RepID=A0A8T3CHT3_9TELE|nr:hypothetical protein AGOR_G00231850 [Albula goreensis]
MFENHWGFWMNFCVYQKRDVGKPLALDWSITFVNYNVDEYISNTNSTQQSARAEEGGPLHTLTANHRTPDGEKLSEDGVKEARECGRLLREHGYQFDRVFTSLLSRSIHTAWLVLEAMGQEWVPVVKSWRLNERHYGALIGLNRAEMALNHGEAQVKIWRRSYDVTPPPIDESHPYFFEIYNDRRYSTCDVPKEDLPRSESLKEVLDRLLPYWENVIIPEIKRGQAVLISAHGNSCRALLKHIEGISDTDIVGVTLPTGIPILLELDEDLRPVRPRQLLGDQEKIQAAIKKVEDQGKAKQTGK